MTSHVKIELGPKDHIDHETQRAFGRIGNASDPSTLAQYVSEPSERSKEHARQRDSRMT